MARSRKKRGASDGDVPPLEDMTELVEHVKALKSHMDSASMHESHAQTTSTGTRLAHNTTNNGSVEQKSSQRKSRANTRPGTDCECEKTQEPQHVESSDNGGSFGGLRKGFLLSSTGGGRKKSSQPPKTAPGNTSSGAKSSAAPGGGGKEKGVSEEIPLIRPSDGGKKGQSLELPEVQEAMKESVPLLANQDWVTDDLLARIKESPVLSKVLTNPQLAEVLTRFQSDPQAVMAAVRDQPEMQQFLQEFCALMGEHFTALANEEDREKGRGKKKRGGGGGGSGGALLQEPLISEVSPEAFGDDDKMRELLAIPEVRSVLADREVQELILVLKSNPDQAQSLMRSASPELQQKVEVMIRHGLLGFQHF